MGIFFGDHRGWNPSRTDGQQIVYYGDRIGRLETDDYDYKDFDAYEVRFAKE